MKRLDDPAVVADEYASEERFERRAALWRRVEGTDPHRVAFEAVLEASPRRVLEVGCGRGELAERLQAAGVEVVAVDLSPRMVELARARGVDARVGDVQELPFADGSFDVATANLVLYHVPDLDRGLGELARVLRPGGRLVAATNGERNFREIWELFGGRADRVHPFSAENGRARLERHFGRVESRPAGGAVTVSYEEAREYVAASVVRSWLVDELPREGWPRVAHRRSAVFVCDREAA